MLDESTVRDFKEQGYVIVHDLFNAEEVRAMKVVIESFRQGELLKNSSLIEGRPNIQLHRLSDKSPVFRALPWHGPVRDAVFSLVGGPAMLELDGQLFLKPAQTGCGTRWHQDNAYLQAPDPVEGVGMWIALDDAGVDNGTLHVVPRVHTSGNFTHMRDAANDHLWTCAETLPEMLEAAKAHAPVPCVVKAGGAVFFSYGTPHCTLDNKSDSDRASVSYHFRYCRDMEAWEYRHPLLTLERSLGVDRSGVVVADSFVTESQRVLQSAELKCKLPISESGWPQSWFCWPDDSDTWVFCPVLHTMRIRLLDQRSEVLLEVHDFEVCRRTSWSNAKMHVCRALRDSRKFTNAWMDSASCRIWYLGRRRGDDCLVFREEDLDPNEEIRIQGEMCYAEERASQECTGATHTSENVSA